MTRAAAVVPVPPPFEELPEGVRALRNERERAFVWAYLFNGANATQAARIAGYSDKSGGARVAGHRLMVRSDIQAALQELTSKYLFSLAPKAVVRLGQLLDKPDHRQHAKAIEMTLSRTGFVERTAVDVNHSGQIAVSHTQAAVDDLRRMVAMGVPREKLVEAFGYSGLSRYEKLLASENAKLIEGTADDVSNGADSKPAG